VRDYVQVLGAFLWGFGCAVLGICCEATAHTLIYSGQTLLGWSDGLWGEAFELDIEE
jgi:hypothetical protein